MSNEEKLEKAKLFEIFNRMYETYPEELSEMNKLSKEEVLGFYFSIIDFYENCCRKEKQDECNTGLIVNMLHNLKASAVDTLAKDSNNLYPMKISAIVEGTIFYANYLYYFRNKYELKQEGNFFYSMGRLFFNSLESLIREKFNIFHIKK